MGFALPTEVVVIYMQMIIVKVEIWGYKKSLGIVSKIC